MQSQISEQIEILRCAQAADDIDHAVDALAKHGECAMPCLLEATKAIPASKMLRSRFIQAIRKIGYPSNCTALPILVCTAANINAPSNVLAIETLKEIGTPAIPQIRETLRFYSHGECQDAPAVDSLCSLLAVLGSPVIDTLLPELLELLEREDSWFDLAAIAPLGVIGSPKANDAVRILQRKILDGSKTQGVRKAAIDVLDKFDPLAVRPVAGALRTCLSDKSEPIRSSAKKMLAWLGQ